MRKIAKGSKGVVKVNSFLRVINACMCKKFEVYFKNSLSINGIDVQSLTDKTNRRTNRRHQYVSQIWLCNPANNRSQYLQWLLKHTLDNNFTRDNKSVTLELLFSFFRYIQHTWSQYPQQTLRYAQDKKNRAIIQ